MTARLSSEVGVAESGVAESGGRDANGAAEAQRAADLIATLGAQNKAQREQLEGLRLVAQARGEELRSLEAFLLKLCASCVCLLYERCQTIDTRHPKCRH